MYNKHKKQYKENLVMAKVNTETGAESFFDEWTANGGLITQAETARLFDCHSAYIIQLCREGKLRKININGKKYLSFPEVFNFYKARKARKPKAPELTLKP